MINGVEEVLILLFTAFGLLFNGDDFLAFFESQSKNGLAWVEHWFLRSPVARKFDDDESVYIKVMQSLFLPLPELLEKRLVQGLKCPNPNCLSSAHGEPHDFAIHDPYGHFTVFGSGNKANVAGEKWSSDTFIHNELMSYLGNEFKKIPGLSYTHEFTDAMVHPISLKSGADGTVEHERLHPDGILTSGDSKIFIILAMSGAFSECSLKTKA
ncbi:unnamed protein product [Bathycoccus prasinos]